ncbi:MAG: hypothetical protein R6U96_00285 [Promethearchaeia archaeon]
MELEIIIQLIFIALGMVVLSRIFNRIFGLSPDKMKGMREKAQNLQERIRNAQTMGDPQMMHDLQVESQELMKDMAKRQFLPMCIRCIIFLGIFSVIGLIYGQYDGWFWVYFISSLVFSFSAMGLRYAYRKITGKEKKSRGIGELMNMMSPTQQDFSQGIQIPTQNTRQKDGTAQPSWKERLNSNRVIDITDHLPEEEQVSQDEADEDQEQKE